MPHARSSDPGVPGDPPPRTTLKRVGHKGAHHLAPGNTFASFEAALAHGVDIIEFDVLKRLNGQIVLAHDREDVRSRTPLTLDEGLDHFAADAYNGVQLIVDMKNAGFEQEIVEGLVRRGLTARAIVSSMHAGSIAEIRRLEPGVRVALSIPKVGRDWTRSRFKFVIYPWMLWIRQTAPRRMARAIAAGKIDTVMVFHRLFTPRLLAAVRRAGGEVFVWTVDDAAAIARFEAIGVDGVISNDPRLFDATVERA